MKRSREANDDLARRVEAITWYHTFDLPGGIVTPGLFDHRKVVHKLPIPASLEGKRCLDAASSDGFFAYEMARRGAAEVVSVDLADASRQDYQRPPKDHAKLTLGTGRATEAFEIVGECLGLDVQRVDLSLYDLDPATLGQFDFVFMGNILLHLSDPSRALRALATVTKPDGRLLSFEAVNLTLSVLRPKTPAGQFWHEDSGQWWTPNMVGHRRILHAGGWDVLDHGGPLFQPFGTHKRRVPRKVPTNGRDLLYWVWTRQVGGSTAWAIARPADV
ncbi:MAG: class I SAM-dependent methyltransferase [Acidimicrobiales bacterium]|nr:class I SAM-dependent methyltransferase [Acidimicrobiales bacterium]